MECAAGMREFGSSASFRPEAKFLEDADGPRSDMSIHQALSPIFEKALDDILSRHPDWRTTIAGRLDSIGNVLAYQKPYAFAYQRDVSSGDEDVLKTFSTPDTGGRFEDVVQLVCYGGLWFAARAASREISTDFIFSSVDLVRTLSRQRAESFASIAASYNGMVEVPLVQPAKACEAAMSLS